ncbi:hypothetical protein B0H16DRAFT_1782372 [Mycena metata]|uniref:F-box domain-containing protein n=1 Tax=Mycena metata TaxID=1033252 RepID=A0AAD7MNF0_9AGAR|nr:hypothetical protein B0H16DRAFT_1782372 [Mycena metata]
MTTRRLFQTALISVQLFRVVQLFLIFLENHEPEEDELSDSDSESESHMTHEKMYKTYDFELPSPTDDWETFADETRVTQEIRQYQATHSDAQDVEGEEDCKASPPDIGSIEPQAGLSTLPIELALKVTRQLPFADRARFATTSHLGIILAADVLQSAATRILLHFQLQFTAIRLLLTATGAAIIGSAVTSLMRIGDFFVPDNLDFVVGDRKGPWVTDYLTMAGYTLFDENAEYVNANGIRRVWSMGLHGLKINVLESLSNNPLDVVTFSNMSCVYGAWLADGIWHGYPQLTTRGITVTTPRSFPVGQGIANHRRVWDIVHKYLDRGFTFRLNEYDEHHRCGTNFNCPATLRTSDDAGCSYSPFPHWSLSGDYVPHRVVCWSMGGTGCSKGILNRKNEEIRAGSAASGKPMNTFEQQSAYVAIYRRFLVSPFNALHQVPHPAIEVRSVQNSGRRMMRYDARAGVHYSAPATTHETETKTPCIY